MTVFGSDRFVRVPTGLLDVLIRTRLSDIQWRIFFWTIRQTSGWNRRWARFSWYRIAKELGCDRSAVYRAGRQLLLRRMIVQRPSQLAVQTNAAAWDNSMNKGKSGAAEQPWITLDGEESRALSPDNETVVRKQRFSVERKTGVKTIKRRRGGGYVNNSPAAEINPLDELMNFYGDLRGDALGPHEATRF